MDLLLSSMGKEVLPVQEGDLIRWDTGSPSMVEVEAFCASSLEKQPQGGAMLLTLSLEGERVPRLSELRKLIHLLEPLIEQGRILRIFCKSLATQKLLGFCGFPLVAELSEGREFRSKLRWGIKETEKTWDLKKENSLQSKEEWKTQEDAEAIPEIGRTA